jgi:hypothetical protein
MAEQSTTFRGPETPDALLADRERTWGAFTGATMTAVIVTVVVLVGMAFFLL